MKHNYNTNTNSTFYGFYNMRTGMFYSDDGGETAEIHEAYTLGTFDRAVSHKIKLSLDKYNIAKIDQEITTKYGIQVVPI